MKITADLTGKCALVTGGASGIGLATVRAFAEAGAKVAINDLPNSPALTKQVAKLNAEGFNVIAAPADISNDDDVNMMIERVALELGGIDYLVNNAAAPFTKSAILPQDMEAQSDEFWMKILSLNLIGPYRCIRAARPYLLKSKGAVVNVASTAAFGGGGSSTAYASSKAALVLMTTELAKALSPDVRVNAIAPGWVGRSGWACQWEEAEANEAAKVLPLQRVGYPEDFAECIFFLAVSAGYVTGQTLLVDGGQMSGGLG